MTAFKDKKRVEKHGRRLSSEQVDEKVEEDIGGLWQIGMIDMDSADKRDDLDIEIGTDD